MKFLGLHIKRLNRWSYFLTNLVSMFVFVGAGLLLGSLFDSVVGINNNGEPNPYFLIPFMVAWFPYAYYCAVRRFHDMGASGWWAIGAFLPYASLVAGAFLLFKSGNPDSNKYGDPQKGVAIMGLQRGHKSTAKS